MVEEVCPKCGSSQFIQQKTLLIAKYSPEAIEARKHKAGFIRLDQVAVDECRQEVLKPAPLDQFLEGYFCQKCEVGFAPDYILGE